MVHVISEELYIKHYGTPRHSGRYPWGSGGNSRQNSASFLGMVDDLKEQGLKETEIAKAMGMTTTQLRATRSIAKNEQRQDNIRMAQRLKDKGYSNVAIGKRMGINESSVRSLLAPGAADKVNVLVATTDMLRQQAEDKGYIDVGTGVESHLGISRTKLNTAVAALETEGYVTKNVDVKQLGTGKYTTVKVLAKEGTTDSEIYRNLDNISQLNQIDKYSDDGGRTFYGLEPPKPISNKRVAVNYSEDGGDQADGVIFVRPGVDDVSLGNARYAQVRINVDGTHYLKGMAVYNSDLPDGVDLMFNTNKSKKNVSSDLDAMKPLKDDPDNPFGAVIRRQRGVMNVLDEEGAWQDWNRTLSSQVLSKQNPSLAKTQLDMRYEQKRGDLDDILALTNPTVRRKLLDTFADSSDSSAVHLEAAALPRQGYHVILPVKSMKPNEVYAPNYKDGERVVLIRYPHGGTFEIPELVVNNKQREARSTIGKNAADAIGIHKSVADRLSGADFDGDTVLVIPNNSRKIKTSPPLDGLKDFDPMQYKVENKTMSAAAKGMHMGGVSNLITDMTIRGASQSELARAVRHSMVVIDAEKHNLDYKASARDNGILALKKKYQSDSNGLGSSTIISRAKSPVYLPARRAARVSEGGPVDKKTGKKVFVETGAYYTNKKGEKVYRKTKSKALAEVDDARELSSGFRIEEIYADHSNRLKSLANEARRASVNTKNTPRSPSAAKVYSKEVSSLNDKLAVAERNRPLERQAQVLANAVVKQKKLSNPNLTSEEVKKIERQSLAEARVRTGAKKQEIEITPSEWEAIQAGAISNNKLSPILDKADLDVVREYATPRNKPLMSPSKTRRAEQMANSGYTQAEIASALGVSTTTLYRATSEGG